MPEAFPPRVTPVRNCPSNDHGRRHLVESHTPCTAVSWTNSISDDILGGRGGTAARGRHEGGRDRSSPRKLECLRNARILQELETLPSSRSAPRGLHGTVPRREPLSGRPIIALDPATPPPRRWYGPLTWNTFCLRPEYHVVTPRAAWFRVSVGRSKPHDGVTSISCCSDTNTE